MPTYAKKMKNKVHQKTAVLRAAVFEIAAKNLRERGRKNTPPPQHGAG